MSEEINTNTGKSKAPTHVAYSVSKANKGAFWDRVGIAWVNEKSIAIQLKAVPLDGRITLRPVQEKQ